ncbi:ornithine carbamoyltransferase [Candidatus Bipolaricaulota bacterium]
MGYSTLFGKDLVCIKDWTKEELDVVLDLAAQFKRRYYSNEPLHCLQDKTFFMLFFADSTRTRTSFETAMTELGGHAQYIHPETMRLSLERIPTGKGESIRDTANVLSRMGHGIGIRLLVDQVQNVGEATAIEYEFARWSSVPIINMMSDYWHPCQALADMMTLREKLDDPRGKKITVTWAYSPWARDWGSITSTSMIYARYGMEVTLAHPKGYELMPPEAIDLASQYASESGGSFRIVNELDEGLDGADVVFPRNWVSSKRYEHGKEEEIRLAERHKDWTFSRKRREELTNNARLLHVMPIDRDNEADSELVDDPEVSWLYDQAENRLHSQKAILALTMGGRV